MKTHAGVAQKMFETLSQENININVISTSEIKLSVLIERKYLELAVRSLHDAFGLQNTAGCINVTNSGLQIRLYLCNTLSGLR